GDVDHCAEALDHGALFGLDGVEARECRPAEDENQEDGDEAELALAAAPTATTGATTTAAASRENLLEQLGEIRWPGVAPRAHIDGCDHEYSAVKSTHSLTGRAA